MAKRYPYWFLLPASLVFAVLYIAPTLAGFYFSMTDWSIYNYEHVRFIGFKHFQTLIHSFSSSDFYNALKNTFIFASGATVLQNVIGFALALLMNEPLRGRNVYRAVFFLPFIMSSLVIGYVFSAILHPSGILNEWLALIGLEGLARDWLGDGKSGIYAITAVHIWHTAGFIMVIHLAGLQNISKEMLEAAQIDGSRYFRSLRSIIIPLMAPSLIVSILLSIIGSLKVFEIVYVMTGGGPGKATQVVNIFIWQQFADGDFGLGAAAGILLFLVISLIAFIILPLLKRREVEL